MNAKLDPLPKSDGAPLYCTVEYNPRVWPYTEMCKSLADGLIPEEIYVNMHDKSCMRAVCDEHWEELQRFF